MNANQSDPATNGATASAPASGEATRSDSTVSSGQTSSAPAGTIDGIDKAYVERLKASVAGNTRMWDEFKALGINGQDDLRRAVELARRVREADKPQEVPLEKRPLDTSTIQQLFRNELSQYDAAKRQESAKQEYQSAIVAESRALDGLLAGDRFAKLTGGKGFDEAIEGRAGVAAHLFAVALNDEIVRATTDPATGRRVPVTDQTRIREIAEGVVRKFSEFKADMLLAGAPSSSAPASKGSGNAPPAGGLQTVKPESRGRYADRVSQTHEIEQGAQDTFQEALRRYSGQ